MGNHASSAVLPPSSHYQSRILPESFFTRYTQHSSDAYSSTSIVFRSSDEQYFSLRKKDIDAHAGALIPSTWNSRSLIAELPEASTTLRTLFAFIRAGNHPTLLNESFETLAEITKAAEKYKVFSAINICAERMRSFGDRHPKLVLLYAAHNDHHHIFDECAPRVITSEKLDSIVPLLPEHLRLPWLRYHARWSNALTNIISYSYSSDLSDAWKNTNCWESCGRLVFQVLEAGVHSLNDPSWIFADRTYTQTQIDGVGAFSETCLDCESAAEGQS
ncbi:hypothetical protein D9756_011286 [Leucocoprinus leucothites]|uniref:BTB domain-containing protein n=1 Tax=Leucocoprinus leucothites TaxID=201217 RepID=A0A8H5FPW6_9AGAR|nr:hypothetical protein D9756_011286 [Leucoagaricus leucothites]